METAKEVARYLIANRRHFVPWKMRFQWKPAVAVSVIAVLIVFLPGSIVSLHPFAMRHNLSGWVCLTGGSLLDAVFLYYAGTLAVTARQHVKGL